MAIISIRNQVRQEAIEMVTSQFMDTYKGKVHKHLFCKIINSFFRRAVKEMFKRWTLTTPIGSFYIDKTEVNYNNNYISHAATRKVRKETGDPNVVIYRTADQDFFKFFWARPKLIHSLEPYSFKPARSNFRAIDKNKETLRLYAV